MKNKYKIFFAIPFDSASRNLYECIKKRIWERYSEFELTMVFGKEEVSPSRKSFPIASFKTQNQQLIDQFKLQIQQSDVVIADLTNNNPNVHFELGIALMYNKNILRVTGRTLKELGFDIQGLEVHQYDDYETLEKIVLDYLGTFFKIKQLTISSDHGDLYWKESGIQLTPRPYFQGSSRFMYRPIRDYRYMLRDGAVVVKFRNVKEYAPDNWFGVYFRSSYDPLMGSYLLFVRPGGEVELVVYPGPAKIQQPQTYRGTKEPHTLLIEFGDSQLNVKFNSKSYLKKQNILSRQISGNIFVAAWNADIDVHSVEMICRDTMDWS